MNADLRVIAEELMRIAESEQALNISFELNCIGNGLLEYSLKFLSHDPRGQVKFKYPWGTFDAVTGEQIM